MRLELRGLAAVYVFHTKSQHSKGKTAHVFNVSHEKPTFWDFSLTLVNNFLKMNIYFELTE